MKIQKVHCLFEQSGTFKNEFKKLGVDAEDYDVIIKPKYEVNKKARYHK